MHLDAGGPVADEEFARLIGPFRLKGALVVAVSGGGDSMALLALLSRWVKNSGAGCQITALTVDHRLRPESAGEARQVAAWCRGLRVGHKTLKVTAPPPTSGLQEWARARRYELMCQWARDAGGVPVLLAHTLDDQAETLLMRLARGSGVDGLAAMALETSRYGVRLLRPLLGMPRERLRRTLAALGQDWLEDPSNEDGRFERVRARQTLGMLEPLGIDIRRLADTAAAMDRAKRALERQTSQCLKDVHWGALGEVEFDPDRLAREEREIGLRALRRILGAVSGPAPPPRLDSLESLLDWAVEGAGAARTLHGCVLRRVSGGRIVAARELARCAPPVKVRAGQEAVWDGRWRVSLRLGEPCMVGALGAEWRTEGQLPRQVVRQTLPAFRRKGRVVAVPPLGVHEGSRQGSASAHLLAWQKAEQDMPSGS